MSVSQEEQGQGREQEHRGEDNAYPVTRTEPADIMRVFVRGLGRIIERKEEWDGESE